MIPNVILLAGAIAIQTWSASDTPELTLLETVSQTSPAQPSVPPVLTPTPLFTRTASSWLTNQVFYGIIGGAAGLGVIILAIIAIACVRASKKRRRDAAAADPGSGTINLEPLN
jgi:hypothetical protein